MQKNGFLPVFEVLRGPLVESLHLGAIAVVDRDGNLLFHHGDPDYVTFMRSSAKPFQAMPFVEAGGLDFYGLNEKELALICASHAGTKKHVTIARAIQSKIGIDEKQLLCGTHLPFDVKARDQLIASGKPSTSNHSDCSGKHSGMLGFARMMGWPTVNYVDPEHPVQKRILSNLAEMLRIEPGSITLGIDGCSVPTFAVPLRNAATGYARLVDSSDLPEKTARACSSIFKAMTTEPFMVSGPGRFDTVLMKAVEGRLVAKGGAEGFQGIGIPPGVLEPGSPGIGIALKILDGGSRARLVGAVALAILDQLGVLTKTEKEELVEYGPSYPLRNWRGILIGEGRPVFNLIKDLDWIGRK